MKRIRWIHFGLIAVILLLIAVFVSILAFNRPLGPSLDLDDPGTAVVQDLPTAIPRLDLPTTTPRKIALPPLRHASRPPLDRPRPSAAKLAASTC